MIKKKDLFENIRDYSPQEIASAIRDGVVTMYELKKSTNGQFTPMMQLEVRNILNNKVESPAPEPESVQEPVQKQEQKAVSTPPLESQNLSMPTVSSPIRNDFSRPDAPESSKPDNSIPIDVENLSSQSVINPEISPVQSEVRVDPSPIKLQNEPQIELQTAPRELKVIVATEEKMVPNRVQNTSMPNLIPCPSCNHMVSWRAVACPKCGYPIAKAEGITNKHLSKMMSANNEMPMGEPSNLKKFSWGGFVFGWIWGVFNGVYWSLLQFIPFVSFVVAIVLGIVGRRSAWNSSKKWASAQAFESAQHSWDMAGIIVFVGSIVISVILLIVIFSLDY